jgi:hypothetical protein
MYDFYRDDLGAWARSYPRLMLSSSLLQRPENQEEAVQPQQLFIGMKQRLDEQQEELVISDLKRRHELEGGASFQGGSQAVSDADSEDEREGRREDGDASDVEDDAAVDGDGTGEGDNDDEDDCDKDNEGGASRETCKIVCIDAANFRRTDFSCLLKCRMHLIRDI